MVTRQAVIDAAIAVVVASIARFPYPGRDLSVRIETVPILGDGPAGLCAGEQGAARISITIPISVPEEETHQCFVDDFITVVVVAVAHLIRKRIHRRIGIIAAEWHTGGAGIAGTKIAVAVLIDGVHLIECTVAVLVDSIHLIARSRVDRGIVVVAITGLRGTTP